MNKANAFGTPSRLPLHSVTLRATLWFNALRGGAPSVTIASALAASGCAGPSSDSRSSQASNQAATISAPTQAVSDPEHATLSPGVAEYFGRADRPLFPHIRATKLLDRLEIDARVSPMLVVDPRTPLFYLEAICCAPDTREHESLLVTDAKPSHVHAALLAMGLKPGKPGAWEMRGQELVPLTPTGDRVSVTFKHELSNGTMQEVSPIAWITSTRALATSEAKADPAPTLGEDAAQTPRARATRDITDVLGQGAAVEWVFAGSRLIERPEGRSSAHVPPFATHYDADGTGQIIGLHTFGSEVLAWPVNLNPDANALEPEWIARMDAIPPAGSPVTIVIRKAEQPQKK